MSSVPCWVGSIVDAVGKGVGSRLWVFWEGWRSVADWESLLSGEEQDIMTTPARTNEYMSRVVFLCMML